MIASLAFFALDAILDWPVVLYDASWSQWGQMSGDNAKGGQLRSDSPWRTDTAARSDLFVYTYDAAAGPVFFAGTGLNDMTAGGSFTGTANRSFRVQIDVTGAPDTFSWSDDGTATWDGTGVPITGAAQILAEGMEVTFGATTGHTLGDRWDFITKRPVELLALDGGACSARWNIDSTKTYDPANCTPVSPDSYAASANQIEEEDAAYMSGGGGGGGGGGPAIPGY